MNLNNNRFNNFTNNSQLILIASIKHCSKNDEIKILQEYKNKKKIIYICRKL